MIQSDRETKVIVADYYRKRQRARTDLLWLANSVLGYPDINQDEHGEILEVLQKFPGGQEYFSGASEEWVEYRPFKDVWDLEGNRNTLTIYPRGTYKTCLISISHAIQWIINFPDVAGILSTAVGEQGDKTMNALLGHFRWNTVFRWLFPEYCPPARNAKDWGSLEQFTVPCRKMKWLRDPTLARASIGKVMSGAHVHFIKHSDVVDKENSRTPKQIQDVKEHLGYCNFLLHRDPRPPNKYGWIDIEGTFYDFSDAYNDTIEKQQGNPNWKIIVKPPYRKDGSVAYPKTLSEEALKIIKSQPGMTDYIFSCQILLNPVAAGYGLCTLEQLEKLFVPRKFLNQIRPQLRIYATVDLAGMEQGNTGDFTVLTVAGFDRDGRMYVLDIRHGRFTPHQVIENIFDIQAKYPRIIQIKIEKDAHGRVLGAFLRREMGKRQKFPPVVAIPRDTRTSKKWRIKGLQPWFHNGTIRFADDLACRIDLIHEVTRFSDTSTYHDDILDTLADQMQNSDGEVLGDVVPNEPRFEGWRGHGPIPKFLGFGPDGQPMWSGQEESHCYDPVTGL